MRVVDTLIPYDIVPHKGIQYSTCRDYSHISRYKALRQVIHNPKELEERFVASETPNPFESHTDVMYYDVPADEENRLDIIAYKLLGAATYGWVIAYFNGIEDGFTVREGQRLKIPKSVSSLFDSGEILASVNALQLNLSSE